MDEPTNSTTSTVTPDPAYPRPTSESVQIALDHFRQRAVDLRAASDRAAASRHAERGGALDDATRAAGAARHEADTARQQARDQRDEAISLRVLADDLEQAAGNPQADVHFARQQAERHRGLQRAAEQRAERLERAAEESGARAEALDQRVAELQQAYGDESVTIRLHEAAEGMDRAVEQLEEKVRLLTEAEALERDAADREARGETLDAELYRGEAAAVRARADDIRPEFPEIDQRIVDAADRPWATDAEPTAGTGDGPQPVPTPGSPARPGRADDADGDGLSDEFERRSGTDVHSADTDGDGYSDGNEVGVPFRNPRAREALDLDPEIAAERDAEYRAWGHEQGLGHNADSDGDGVADWIEQYGLAEVPNLTADDVANNQSPLDDFVGSARSQIGKPYRFGAEVEARQNLGGDAFDSSELVEWAARQAGVRDMPDGSWNQYRWLHEQGAAMSVDEALQTKGALVFGFSSDPLASAARPALAYVAISMGDGTVLDVSERAGEVRVTDPGGFYAYAAKIPALHEPTGDLDGDGWTDQEEMAVGGDPSRSITVPRGTDDIVIPDGTGDATPDGTGDGPGEGDDPLGTDRYPSVEPTGLPDGGAHDDGSYGETAYGDPSYDGPTYGENPGSGQPGAGTDLAHLADATDVTDLTGGDTGDGSPAPAAAAGGGDTLGTYGAPAPDADGPGHGDAGPTAGDAYGDSSYGDSGADDIYDDAYTDASTYE